MLDSGYFLNAAAKSVAGFDSPNQEVDAPPPPYIWRFFCVQSLAHLAGRAGSHVLAGASCRSVNPFGPPFFIDRIKVG